MPSFRQDHQLPVLYEDNHLLVVNKPAGLATMGVAADRDSVLTVAKQYIARKYDKPGNVYLGVVSRLDAPVTGALLIARTSKAAGRMSKQFRDRAVEKVYWAIVAGEPPDAAGTLEHWLRKDERHRRMHVTMQTEGAQQARLHYQVIQPLPGDQTLLQIKLETGRKHQIRVQLSAARMPIVGDRKYRSERAFPEGIALHSRKLTLEHPVRRSPLTLAAPLPGYWPAAAREIAK